MAVKARNGHLPAHTIVLASMIITAQMPKYLLTHLATPNIVKDLNLILPRIPFGDIVGARDFAGWLHKTKKVKFELNFIIY